MALEVGGSSPLGHPIPHRRSWLSKSYTLPTSLWFFRSLWGSPLLQKDGLRPPTSILPLDTSQATDSNTASRDV